MTGTDWTKVRDRARVGKQGSEAVSDDGLPIEFRAPPKKRVSKASLRDEAAAAIASVSRIVRCAGCGHSATVALPPARLGARLRCSKCNEVAQ